MPSQRARRTLLRNLFTFVLNAGVFFCIGLALLMDPTSPLPPEWRPTAALRVDQPITPLTQLRLRMTIADPAACRAALAAHQPNVRQLDPAEISEQCHIRNRVGLPDIGAASLGLNETSCATALRLAMWEAHSLQPLAAEILGSQITDIHHVGSYSCRRIRTSQGSSDRWSSHSTADAIDISGFELASGLRLNLIEDWDDDGPESEFLQAAHQEACRWFPLTLGPNYNALHADHFHLQSTGWGLCR